MDSNRRALLAGGLGAAALIAIAPARSQFTTSRSLLEFVPAAHHAAIRAGTSRFDCAPALQRAIDITAAGGQTLTVPAGTYVLVPATRILDEDPRGTCLGAVVMRSGMRIVGDAGAVLRIRDGISTDRAPQRMGMFCSDRPIADVSIIGLTMDMNGRANLISRDRRSQRYSRHNMSHILVSGTPGGVAARIDNAHVERCRFLNTAGVCCIVMAQSNAPGVRLGRGWRVIDNEFRDNGIDTDDHTSVYGWADDVVATGNRFSNSMFVGTERRRAGVTCYEVHGSNHRVSGNQFNDYFRGIWVAPNLSTPVTGTRIVDNSFATQAFGVDFFGDRPGGTEISDTVIERNRFVFAEERRLAAFGIDLKACVQVASQTSQRGVTVTGNTARATGSAIASAFAVITGGGAGGGVHDAITITDNQADGLTFGSFIRTSPTAGLGAITVQRNRWLNLTPTPAFTVAVGDGVGHTFRRHRIASLALGGGVVTGAAGHGARIQGVRVDAWVDRLDVAAITTTNVASAYWEETEAIVRSRRGLAARR